MLIDEVMPEFDVSDKYRETIAAPVGTVWDTLWTTNICDSAVVNTLFMLRGLKSGSVTLSTLEDLGFRLIAEKRYSEVVFGLIGKVWTIEGGLREFEAGSFKDFSEAGYAKCAWSFSLEEDGGSTVATTETRVLCTDQDSRWYFDLYWTFVRPFSGWTRKEMLALVKNAAEKSGGAGSEEEE
ncbi:MAG: hypothetical protein R2684_02055 [Pyrinomonadaceae bacterium]